MGYFKAEDTGGAIRVNRIDIFMGDYKKAKEFGIEKQFLKKIVTSTEEIETLLIAPDKIGKLAFVCSLSLAELKKQKFKGAVDYVSWGAKQVTEKKGKHTKARIAWPDVPSVSGNSPEWHCLYLNTAGDFIVPLLIRERFFFAANPRQMLETNMFYHGRFINRTLTDLGVAVVNSTIVYLLLEIYGRHNIEGRFNIYGPELYPLPIPNLTLFSEKQQKEVCKSSRITTRRSLA